MHEDLHELIAAWLGEEIGDERRDRLREKLRIDSEFRAAFVTEARTFAMLQVVQTAEPRWLSLQDELGIADAAAPSLEERVRIALQENPPLPFARWWYRLAALAACVAVLFTTAYLIRSWVVSSPAEESIREADRLAVVVGVEDIAWEHSQKPLRQGDSVSTGTLSFSSGKLTLAFLNGVSLHAEGPAKIQIAAPDRIVCLRGNLRARIVPGAEGFTIETPGAAVVDLGTELGIHVDQGGRSQVVVYEGLAEATLLGPDGSPNRTQTLKAEQSVELDPHKGTMRSLAMRELLSSPKLDIPPLQLAADYPQRVLAAKARYYWPTTQVQDGQIRDRVQDGMSLSLVGPIEAMTDGSLSFIESSEPQYLRAEGAWSPPKQFAVELWFASNAFTIAPWLFCKHRHRTMEIWLCLS